MTSTSQITVRLPDDLVTWLDAEVARGRFASRAAGVAKLIARAERAQRAERDMAIVLAAGPDPQRESMLAWAETREYPDMEEPAKVLHPERFPDLADDDAKR